VTKPPSGTFYMLAKTFRQMLVIRGKMSAIRAHLAGAMAGIPRATVRRGTTIIKQARRYKSKREITRAIRLIARADLALGSNPRAMRCYWKIWC